MAYVVTFSRELPIEACFDDSFFIADLEAWLISQGATEIEVNYE